MKVPTALAAHFSLLLIPVLADGTPIQWADNGHYYEVVASEDIAWKDAYDAAVASSHLGQPGYLATVTSASEQEFVASLLTGGFQYWVGGYQAAGSPNPGAGWMWDTTEPWSYTNWANGQPDDNGTCGGLESFLAINVSYGRFWNDEDDPGCRCHGYLDGYVVEYGGYTGVLSGLLESCGGQDGGGRGSGGIKKRIDQRP